LTEFTSLYSLNTQRGWHTSKHERQIKLYYNLINVHRIIQSVMANLSVTPTCSDHWWSSSGRSYGVYRRNYI